jgi:sialate O-acetylesterase
LQTPAASFVPHTITITAGKESRTLKNVLVGDVWLCSGQSNMEFKVKQTTDMLNALKGEMNQNIRLFNTGRISAETPQNDVPTHNDNKGNYNTPNWVVCNAEDLSVFSAVGFGFGRELQETLNIPIGLIDASFGGTFVEGWL